MRWEGDGGTVSRESLSLREAYWRRAETTGARVKAFSVLSPSPSRNAAEAHHQRLLNLGRAYHTHSGGEMGFRDTPSTPQCSSSLLPAGKVYRAKGGGLNNAALDMGPPRRRRRRRPRARRRTRRRRRVSFRSRSSSQIPPSLRPQ